MTSVTNHRLLRKHLRDFSVQVKPWQAAIYHTVKPDEVYNTPLIALRVYGDAQMFHVVAGCAGLDSVEQGITALTLMLPTWTTYLNMVRVCNGS